MPAVAVAEEVTDKVTVVSVEPAEMVREALLREHVQPAGQEYVRLKVEEPQPVESLFWIE